jgi:hypothetical protein
MNPAGAYPARFPRPARAAGRLVAAATLLLAAAAAAGEAPSGTGAAPGAPLEQGTEPQIRREPVLPPTRAFVKPPAVGEAAPEIPLRDPQGKAFTLREEAAGKIVVLVFYIGYT